MAYPPFQQAMTDPKTGLLTQPWVMFFLSVFGGGSAGGGLAPASAPYVLTAAVPVLPNGQVLTSPLLTGVTAGTYGDTMHVGQFTVDVNGRLTLAADVAMAGTPAGSGYWSLLTNGDPVTPELIFTADGDVVSVWVA